MTTPDLTTTYLGLKLKNPLVVSASPLSKRLSVVQRLEDAGAAAIVMYSLFEEQITHGSREIDYSLSRSTYSYAEAMSAFPDPDVYNLDPDAYLEHLNRVKQAVQIPVIGSLNATSSGGWINYAQKIEQAGADALELNLYNLPTDINVTGAELEDASIKLVQDVRAIVKIPLALKLSPFFTSIPHMAKRFVEAGANALVLFNRFYQPDLLCDTLQVVPHLELSTSHDLLLPLRWIAILYGRLNVDFALTSGVHSADDVLKAIMAGANVAMMTSEILVHGVERLTTLAADLSQWMEEYKYQSLSDMRGCLSQSAVAEPAVFERTNYVRALHSFDV